MKLTYIKKGDAKQSASGKTYTPLTIKLEEYGNEFINGFSNFTTDKWQVGDNVELEITEKEYNGKMYKNFKTTRSGVSSQALEEINKKLDDIKSTLNVILSYVQVSEIEKTPF